MKTNKATQIFEDLKSLDFIQAADNFKECMEYYTGQLLHEIDDTLCESIQEMFLG